MDNINFKEIAQYLQDPLVLIGFFILIFFSLLVIIIKKGIMNFESSMNDSIKEHFPKGFRYFHVVAMLFCATLLISNTIAVKVIEFSWFTLPAGIIVFPLAYLSGDVLTEIYGYRKTRNVIWWGFFSLGIMSLFYWIATILTPAPFWKSDNPAFIKFFGFAPRIAFASLIAYVIGEFLNSAILSKLKVITKGKHFWLRAIGSTLIGQGADSLIFNLVAFFGIFPFKTVVLIAFSGLEPV